MVCLATAAWKLLASSFSRGHVLLGFLVRRLVFRTPDELVLVVVAAVVVEEEVVGVVVVQRLRSSRHTICLGNVSGGWKFVSGAWKFVSGPMWGWCELVAGELELVTGMGWEARG